MKPMKWGQKFAFFLWEQAFVGLQKYPANKLYETVKQLISGASCGCAEVFGATEELEASGFDLVEESFIQSEVGVPSLYSRIKSGYQIVTF
jgi:hypothetical protein